MHLGLDRLVRYAPLRSPNLSWSTENTTSRRREADAELRCQNTAKMVDTSLASLPSSRLALFAFLSATSLFFLWKSCRLRRRLLLSSSSLLKPPNPIPRGKIIYASATGTSLSLASLLCDRLRSHGLAFDLVDPRLYEPEDLSRETLILIVASTWEDGGPPTDAQFLARWLAESAADFRVGSLLLSKCRFAVFGVGSKSYGNNFNLVARDFSKWMRALGALEMVPIWEGDVDSGDVDEVFESWSRKVIQLIKGEVGVEEEEEHFDSMAESNGFDESEEEPDESLESAVVDMEDIAGKAPSRRSPVAQTNRGENGVREMVTPVLKANLEKQVKSVLH